MPLYHTFIIKRTNPHIHQVNDVFQYFLKNFHAKSKDNERNKRFL